MRDYRPISMYSYKTRSTGPNVLVGCNIKKYIEILRDEKYSKHIHKEQLI